MCFVIEENNGLKQIRLRRAGTASDEVACCTEPGWENYFLVMGIAKSSFDFAVAFREDFVVVLVGINKF